MTPPEHTRSVWLGSRRIGSLHQRGDYTRFRFLPEYLTDAERPVLGLAFEQDPSARHAAALRLPCWFSNLLPEGRLRDWIAAHRGVSPQREMELLAQVGHDLPGAIRVTELTSQGHAFDPELLDGIEETAEKWSPSDAGWRFSLAGVALKFSMLGKGDRFTMPAFGAGGDWIVKLPDRLHRDVPRNEFAMMSLASAVGIDIPEIRLVHRDEIDGLPPDVWTSDEAWAYAVRRFDRGVAREPIHMEDLAQVRNVYPEAKYEGNYETVAGLIYRGHDVASLREFARRLAFTVLISNGDAHLKNWSLIYLHRQIPTLAPAYDLVSTRHYMGAGETLGLKFAGSRRFESVRLTAFDRLERRLGIEAGLTEQAAAVVARTSEQWPQFEDLLVRNDQLRADIGASIAERSRTLQGLADI